MTSMSSTSDPSRMDPYSDDPGAAPTAVLDRQVQEQEQTTDDGDHDRFAHYVRKDKITQAALGGTPVIALCGKGIVHGDLSAYNILAGRDGIVLIDLPQVLDLIANPNGTDFLHRDCVNVCTWFSSKGLERDGDELFAELLAYAF